MTNFVLIGEVFYFYNTCYFIKNLYFPREIR